MSEPHDGDTSIGHTSNGDTSNGDTSNGDTSNDEPSVDDLTLGHHENKAHTPGDLAAPQQVAEAQDFMARHSAVHGHGIGVGADGGPCIVLFAENLPADQVPAILDGLPVRVESSGEFTAGMP